MNEVYTMKGRIYKVYPTEQKTEKFRKREFVIDHTNSTGKGTYVEYVKLQTVQQRCDLLEDLEKGDSVIIKFSVTGRKYKGDKGEQFFTNLDAIEINLIGRSDSVIEDPESVEEFVPMGDGKDEFKNELFGPETQTPQDLDDLPF